MKTSRFTDSQIIAILKQAEAGSPVPELCREHGISNATFYKWRAKYVSGERNARHGQRTRA
jgi:putative transposase